MTPLILLAASGLAYPTVDAALAALRARSDVTITVQDGWTIADDKTNNALWSFAPPDHPAYPALVRRVIVRDGDRAAIDMATLCQGPQPACDQLQAEFQRANAALQQALAPKAVGTGPAWQPTAAQRQRVEQLSRAYFADKDAQRYAEAYQRLGGAMRQQWPFDEWRRAAADGAARSGAVQQREIRKVTIYRSSQSGTPGTYAAVDFTGRFANADTYCAYLLWSEQADGSFQLLREEENYIYKATDARLTDAQRARMRAVFRCAD